jgi:hypothetical protein
MKHKVCKSSILVILFLAGACMLALALSPSIASAAVFTYDKKPAFSITYPNNWEADPENPFKVMFRVKDAVGIPVLDVQVLDIPNGVALADIGKYYKKAILDKEQSVDAEIASNKQTTLKDGTKANEITLKYKWQSWLPLKATILSVYKDNKWVYAAINQSVSSEPWTDVLYSLTFKK